MSQRELVAEWLYSHDEQLEPWANEDVQAHYHRKADSLLALLAQPQDTAMRDFVIACIGDSYNRGSKHDDETANRHDLAVNWVRALAQPDGVQSYGGV